jgi:hypothetical protein
MTSSVSTPRGAPERPASSEQPSQRVLRSLRGRWRSLRAHPLLNPTGLSEMLRERLGGHPVDADHRPHLQEAIGWLVRAQDATPDDGFARGYSVLYYPTFGAQGWQPSYPETTGYIIPTLLEAAYHLARPELVERALRAARWEIDLQLDSGAVQGGVVGEGRTPAIFNTGQVLFGWIAAFETTGDGRYADAARRAGAWLTSVIGPDGTWLEGESQFARKDATLYNARASWALAEAGLALEEPAFRDAAARNLRFVTRTQLANGWFPQCSLSDPEFPLLHTLAYTVRGLVEGGRVLQDSEVLEAGIRAANVLLAMVRSDGFMPGRYRSDWTSTDTWSCLTGEAQMATNWMRLALITKDQRWLEKVPAVLAFLKATQNRSSRNPGLRGGVKGSAPLGGVYGRYQILNWATKYFADALMRHTQQATGEAAVRGMGTYRLA